MLRKLDTETGSAMVISLLTLVLLTAVGTMFLAQTKTETQIAGHDMRATQALFNAEAGYGEALVRMSDAQDSLYVGEPPGPPSPGWGTYLVESAGKAVGDRNYAATETDSLDNNGDGNIDESGERYPETVSFQDGGALNYPWVNIHYMLNTTGQVILFGDHDNDLITPPRYNLASGFPTIIVTSSGDRGSARRTVEVEAVKRPFEIVQTALYTESDDFTFNGTQFLISGVDHNPDTGDPLPGNPEVPGIVTTGDPGNIDGALTLLQEDNVEGAGGEPSTAGSAVDIDLEALAATYRVLAEYVLPAGTYASTSYGDKDNYTIVHCTGNMVTSGGVTGGGVLVVDGNLTMAGAFTWYGMVLVMGDISMTGGGAGIHIYGSTLAQGTVAGDQTISGQADILYSSLALSRLTALSPYTVTNWREVN